MAGKNLIYQRFLKSIGSNSVNSLNASSILVDENLWIQLAGLEFSAASAYNSIQQQEQQQQLERHETNWTAWQLERDGLILTKSKDLPRKRIQPGCCNKNVRCTRRTISDEMGPWRYIKLFVFDGTESFCR